MCCESPLSQFMMSNFVLAADSLIVIDDNAAAPPPPPSKQQQQPKLKRRLSRRSRIEQQRRGRGSRRQQQRQQQRQQSSQQEVAGEPQLCRWGSLPVEASISPERSPAPGLRRAGTDPLPSISALAAPQRPQRSSDTRNRSPRLPQRKTSLNLSTTAEDILFQDLVVVDAPQQPRRARTPRRNRVGNNNNKVVISASSA